MISNNIYKNAINIYAFGSIVYGTVNDKSDKDYIVIIPDHLYQQEQFHYKNQDFNFCKESDWMKMICNNDIRCLECHYLKEKFIIKETKKYDLNLNPNKIRKEISTIASNSFVKCKKKLTVEKDFNPYIAKKSLWHSLRLLLFGIQLMQYKNIYNYQEGNRYYNKIVNNENNDWNYYKKIYQPVYNQLKSQFKLAHQNFYQIER